MREIAGYALSIVLIGGALLLLGAIGRFSIISSWRTRHSAARLRVPDLEGVQQVCGFTPPEALDALYRHTGFIERVEFELVDSSSIPSKRWPIGRFQALTPAVVKEFSKVSGVRGIPIADDSDKGTYFVDASGAVMLASPNLPKQVTVVSSSVDLFRTFQPSETGANDGAG